MHIVCGTKANATKTQRRQALQLLREKLETYSAPHPQMRLVRLIVGDDNLSTREARQVLQRTRDADPLWEVYSAVGELQGDHVAVNGTAVTAIDMVHIRIGKSWGVRGMRVDDHDAVAMRLHVAVASQPAENATDGEHDRDASQLAQEEVPDSHGEEVVAPVAACVLDAAQPAENSADGDDASCSVRVGQPTPRLPLSVVRRVAEMCDTLATGHMQLDMSEGRGSTNVALVLAIKADLLAEAAKSRDLRASGALRSPDRHDAVAVVPSVRGASPPVKQAAEGKTVDRSEEPAAEQLANSLASTRLERNSSLREELNNEAAEIHHSMRCMWEDAHDADYDEKVLEALAELLLQTLSLQ